jgi:uncharacterized membrane protein YtjA (UPF0391 family)
MKTNYWIIFSLLIGLTGGICIMFPEIGRLQQSPTIADIWFWVGLILFVISIKSYEK